MRQIGLLGSPGTKRTLYLQQALEQAGIQPLFMDWKDFAAIRETLLKRSEGKLLIKVDPPSWDSINWTIWQRNTDSGLENWHRPGAVDGLHI